MAVFSGFRPFLNKGSTVNGVQNMFFSDGTNGFHYLPDNSVTYNASNLAGFGDGVAAILDKRSGTPSFSSELIVNGSFSQGNTGWTAGTGWSISSGSATANIGVGSNLDQSLSTVLGKTYAITYTISSFTSGSIRVRLTGSSNVNGSIRSAAGTYTEFLYASSNNSIFRITEGGAGFVGSITNVSVKEIISNNSGLQSSSSLRPLLGRAPRIRTNLINNSEDLTTWTRANVTTTADKVMENTTVEMHVARAVAPEIYFNTDYYFTVEVKAAEKNYAVIGAWWTGGVAVGGVIINLINGTYAGDWSRSPGNISATFLGSENVGDGWWRIRVYINNLTNASPAHPIVGLTNSTTTVVNEVYAGTAGHGVFVRKAHASLTPFTVYQKTESNRLITTDETQTSFPFIRLDLSDDVLTTNNIVSQKNLFRATEEFDNGTWVKSGVFISANVEVAPDGTQTADKIVATNGHVGGKLIYQSPNTPSSTYVYSFYAKAAEYYLVRAIEAGNYKYYATFNLNTGVVSASGGTNFVSAQMQSVGNGWYRCAIFVSATTPGSPGAVAFPDNITPPTNTPASYTGDGVSGAYFWGAQIETGATLTSYDYGGMKGDIIVAGKNGTAVETVYAPNGNFSLGPTSYTGGTPGILRAVGDIVGYSLIGRSTTVVEQDQLLDFYKFRGAKGRLVLGSELITNGDFSDGISEWSPNTFYNSIVSLNNGKLRVQSQSDKNYAFVSRTISGLVIGRAYQFKMDIQVIAKAALLYLGYSGSQIAYSTNLPVPAGQNIITFVAQNTNLLVQPGVYLPDADVEFDNLSLKELRPEEEW